MKLLMTLCIAIAIAWVAVWCRARLDGWGLLPTPPSPSAGSPDAATAEEPGKAYARVRRPDGSTKPAAEPSVPTQDKREGADGPPQTAPAPPTLENIKAVVRDAARDGGLEGARKAVQPLEAQVNELTLKINELTLKRQEFEERLKRLEETGAGRTEVAQGLADFRKQKEAMVASFEKVVADVDTIKAKQSVSGYRGPNAVNDPAIEQMKATQVRLEALVADLQKKLAKPEGKQEPPPDPKPVVRPPGWKRADVILPCGFRTNGLVIPPGGMLVRCPKCGMTVPVK